MLRKNTRRKQLLTNCFLIVFMLLSNVSCITVYSVDSKSGSVSKWNLYEHLDNVAKNETKKMPNVSNDNSETQTFKPFISYSNDKDKLLLKVDVGDISEKADELILSSKGDELVISSRDNTVRVFNVSSGQEVRRFLWNLGGPGIEGYPEIALSAEDKFLVVGNGASGKLLVYDYHSGVLVKSIPVSGVVRKLSFSTDGKYLAVAQKDSVLLWDFAENREKKVIPEGAVDVLVVKKSERYFVFQVNLDTMIRVTEFNVKENINSFDYNLMGAHLYSEMGKKEIWKDDYKDSFELHYIAYNEKQQEIAVASRANNFVWIIGIKDGGYPITPPEEEWGRYHGKIFDSNFYFKRYLETKTNLIGNLSYSKNGKYLAIGSTEQGKCGEVYEKNRLVGDLSGKCQAFWPSILIDDSTLVGVNLNTKYLTYWNFNNENEPTRSKYKGPLFPIKASVAFDGNSLAWGTKECKRTSTKGEIKGYDAQCLDLENSLDLNSLKLTNDKSHLSNFKRVSLAKGNYKLDLISNVLRGDKALGLVDTRTDRLVTRISIPPKDGWVPKTWGLADNLVISGNREGHLIGYTYQGKKQFEFIGHTSDVQSLSILGSTLVSSDYSGAIRMWIIPPKDQFGAEAKQIQPIFSFFFDEKGEYLIVSDDGYFAGKTELLEKVWLHIDSDSSDKEARYIKINQLYDQFYRPDIVLARLQRLETITDKPISIAEALECAPPAVKELTVGEVAPGEIEVKFSVTDSGGGIGEIRVYNNGKLSDIVNKSDQFANVDIDDLNHVLSSASEPVRLRAISRISKKISTGETTCDATVNKEVKGQLKIKTVAGENIVRMVAFNSKNSVQSMAREVTYFSNQKARKPKAYVLAIGINEYSNSNINLNYAVQDSELVTKIVHERIENIYPSVEIVNLINDKATKETIINRLQEIKKSAYPDDIFIMFIASHGEVAEQFYIITHNYAWENGIYDPSSWLSSSEILGYLQEIPAQKQFVIFDTCHSGALNDILSNYYEARMSVFTHKSGITMLSATKAAQLAMDNYLGHGLLTHLLQKSFQASPDKDKNGDITVHEIGDEVTLQYEAIKSNVKSGQQPSISKYGSDFVVDKPKWFRF